MEKHEIFFVYFSLLLFLFAHADARAEGNCPDGYFPIGGGSAGWEGCAPMGPAAGAGDAGPQPQWEARWGAIATANGALGVSAGKNSRSIAEQQAMADCQAQSRGKPCKIDLVYHNQCAAVAWGDAGSLWARSADVQDAEAIAMRTCQDKTTNCDIYYSGCSNPERKR